MWSRNFPCCVDCGKTDFRMMADGHCARCYLREYRFNHKNKIAKQKKKWYDTFVIAALNSDIIKTGKDINKPRFPTPGVIGAS